MKSKYPIYDHLYIISCIEINFVKYSFEKKTFYRQLQRYGIGIDKFHL